MKTKKMLLMRALIITMALSALTLHGADTNTGEKPHPLGVQFALTEAGEQWDSSVSLTASPMAPAHDPKAPHNEYASCENRDLSQIPPAFRPNQRNTISWGKCAFRGKALEEPLIFCHDRNGNLYLRQIIRRGTVAICYAVDRGGRVGPAVTYMNQMAHQEKLWDIEYYEDFRTLSVLLASLQRWVRKNKGDCFLNMYGTQYRLTKHDVGFLEAEEISTNARSPLAYLLLGRWHSLGQRLQYKEVNFYTTSCCEIFKKSRNNIVLGFLENAHAVAQFEYED